MTVLLKKYLAVTTISCISRAAQQPGIVMPCLNKAAVDIRLCPGTEIRYMVHYGKKVTSSTEPEVYNVSQCRHRTEPWAWGSAQKFVEDRSHDSGDICVDRQTCRHAHRYTALPYWSGVTMVL